MKNFILNNVKNLCTYPVQQLYRKDPENVESEYGIPTGMHWKIDNIYHNVVYNSELHQIEYSVSCWNEKGSGFMHNNMYVQLTTEEEIQLLVLFQQVVKRYLKDTQQFVVYPYVEDKRDSLLDPLDESEE
jgi:hypothetical protein